MRKNHPQPFMVAFLLLIPFLLISAPLTVLIVKCVELHATLNYNSMWWFLGIGSALTWIIVMRLTWVAETYIWKYIYLERLLQQKGLQSWVDEANNKLK